MEILDLTENYIGEHLFVHLGSLEPIKARDIFIWIKELVLRAQPRLSARDHDVRRGGSVR